MPLKNLVSTFSLLALIGVACGGSNNSTGSGGKAGGSGGSPGMAGGPAGTTGTAGAAGATGTAGATAGTTGTAGGTAGGAGGAAGGYPTTPILNSLKTITTIGSTVDPINDPAIDPTGSGANPYGLAIAPISAGLITAGDLVVCNFNNGPNMLDAGSLLPNTQGQGTTLVGLHPVASANTGGMPYHIAQSKSLLGCSSLSTFADSSIAATAFSANMVPLVAPSGSLSSPFAADNLAKPWGSAYALAPNGQAAALYVSTGTGSINRITLDSPNSSNAQTAFAQIITGFCVSGAVQGQTDSLHAPSGLTYDPKIDTLYVVDTSSYSVVAFDHVSSIAANGITVNGGNCTAGPPTAIPTFMGPSGSSASVIASPNSPNGGQQFNAPISAALLLNGNVVVGNADQDLMPNDAGTNQNLLFEISPTDGIVGMKQLDMDAPGALFGIAAESDGHGNQLIYFNDDNTNTVMLLSK